MPERTRHVVAFYEIDRRYGGPEEGGWWYDCGALRRALRVAASEDAAHVAAARANRLMDRLQRGRPVSVCRACPAEGCLRWVSVHHR